MGQWPCLYAPGMKQQIADWLSRVVTWLFLGIAVLLALIIVEVSVGHDGLLCELGFDSDGAGMTTSGCGGFWRR